MAPTAILNNKGFTLLEFLVAVVILTVGMFALLEAVNYAISQNMTGMLRYEALFVADDQLSLEKTKPFAAISSATSPGKVSSTLVQRSVNGIFRNYSVTKTIVDSGGVDPLVKNIELRVTWKYKQTPYTHTLATIVTKTD